MVLEDKELLCGELLSLIVYGIKKEVEKMPDIIWSVDKMSFTYQGDHFSIGLFRTLVRTLVEEGEQLLKDCLLSEECSAMRQAVHLRDLDEFTLILPGLGTSLSRLA